MYIITAEFMAKSERRDDMIAACKKITSHTIGEAGCISYEFFEDQSCENRFFFFERWASLEAIDAHMQMPYLIEHSKKFISLVVEGTTMAEMHEITKTKRLV